MKQVHNCQSMQELSHTLKAQGKKIGFVPTMGYLHEGHLSLVAQAKAVSDVVVLSIYVNPTQFGPNEDFTKYPRDLNHDLSLCEQAGVDYLFLPETADIYGLSNIPSWTDSLGMGKILCGASRPGHFAGVVQIVTRLFMAVAPTFAIFGEKDFQQLTLIRKMTQDLNLPIQIIGTPIIRSPEGLALSSRNVYLDKEAKQAALLLYQSLNLAKQLCQNGETDIKKIVKQVEALLKSNPLIIIDYIAVVNPSNLLAINQIQVQARLLLAVKIKGTRLIDNASIM